MAACHSLILLALLGMAAPPAWALTVIARTEATNDCRDEVEDAPALCVNADLRGSAVAAADHALNGGVQIEFTGGNQTGYGAGIQFLGTYRNVTAIPQPLRILSILLPGRVQLLGEATVKLGVGMRFATNGRGTLLRHESHMRLDVGGIDPVWEHVVVTAGVPSNWPQTGPVGFDVELPFSVLGFDFGLVGPGDKFHLEYFMGMEGTVQGAFEFVVANIGDPLQLEDMPLFQIDESVFAEVPEPGVAQLLGVGLIGLAARRRVRGRR